MARRSMIEPDRDARQQGDRLRAMRLYLTEDDFVYVSLRWGGDAPAVLDQLLADALDDERRAGRSSPAGNGRAAR